MPTELDEKSLLRSAKASSISIVIPAQNEEDNLAFVLDACLETLRNFGSEYEIIVVDDASKDGTLEIASNYIRVHSKVRVIPMGQDVGPHLCVLTGFLAAKGDLLFFIPADRQILPDQLTTCLMAMVDADYVCTWRVPREDPLPRRIMAKLYNSMLRMVFRLKVHDVDSSVLVRRSVLEKLAPELSSTSTFILTELVLRAQAAGFKIKEVRIDHHPRIAGRASAITPKEVARTLFECSKFAIFVIRIYATSRKL